MTKNPSFPKYSEWFTKYCKLSNEPIVKDSEKMISYCLQLDQQLPSKYGWRFSSEESFLKQVDSCKNPHDLNQLYWLDQARNVEAYSMMTFWRGVELLKPAIRSLNLKEITPPGILARSLLEIACVYNTNANIIEKTFKSIELQQGKVVISKEIERMIVKMIWGTRIGDPKSEIKQTNVLTYIQKVSKNLNAHEVLSTYEYLCEIAHPNFIGNTRFWSHIEKVYADGSEQRVITKYVDKEPTHIILEKIIWSLGWSAAVLRNSFELFQSAISGFVTKLENG